MEPFTIILIGAGSFVLFLIARLAAGLGLRDDHWFNIHVFGFIDSDEDCDADGHGGGD